MKTLIASISLLALLSCVPVFLNAQGWQQVFPSGGSGLSVIQTQDGNLVFLGSDPDVNFGQVPILQKRNSNGQVLWTQTYPGLSGSYLGNVIEQPNGGLLLVGDRSTGASDDTQVFMLFTDALGNQIDINYFGGADYEYANDVIQDAAGNVYVLGASGSSGNGLLDAYVLKFNPSGALLWENTYGFSGYDMATTAQLLPNGEIMAFGWSQDTPGGQDRLYFIRIAANGNELSSQVLYDTRNGDICATADGNFFVATQVLSSFNQRDIKIIKLDPNLNEIWTQTYVYAGYDYPSDIAPTADGGFILTGRSDEPNPKLLLIKGDANGAIEWRQRLGPGLFDTGKRAIELADGSFAFSGNSNLTSTGMFIGKTDSQGNVFSHWLAGRIVLDGNDDCQLDASPIGAPWTVKLDGNPSDFSGTADANGYFNILADTGVYQVSVQIYGNPVFYEQCQPIPAQTLNNFYDTTNMGAILFKHVEPPTENISGYVFYDTNGNCQFDPGESPVPCATVPFSLEGQFNTLFSDESDENGYYEIPVPINDHYYPGTFWSAGFWNCSLGGCSIGGQYVTTGQGFTMNVPLACSPDVAVVAGTVFLDTNNNCQYDTLSETPLHEWHLAAVNTSSSDTVFVNSLPNGVYNFLLGAGQYEIFVQLPNGTWQTCANGLQVEVGEGCHRGFDFPIQAAAMCPLLEVDISVLGLRPCVMSTYYVQYCNLGSETATNAYATVALDSLLSYVSSSLPATQDGSLLSFELGDLAPLQCGSFSIQVFLDCEAQIGATHCVEAHIYPDTSCVAPHPLWDGSSLQLQGKCQGDSILFTIANVGAGDMSQASEYIVIEDNVLIRSAAVQLPGGQDTVIVFYPNGATLRMEAEQTPFHPGNDMPGISLEGCGTNDSGSISLGFVTQYPENDANPAISIECQESVGSLDPNDKRGFPKGVSAGHFIRPNTDLEYQIRFQNTGTAPALEVVIRDTLSPFLKPESLRPGASSHPYTFSLEGGHIAVFTFENINLPDSTAGLEASMGFVKFRISQLNNNQPGTQILNTAAIYFDQNPPIGTNQTKHQIPLPVEEQIFNPEICLGNEWMGFEVLADTTLNQIKHFGFFDSLITYQVAAIEPDWIYADTSLLAGQLFHGLVITVDTILTENLISSLGCDSTVVTSITVLPSGTANQTGGIKASLFPNPASGSFYVEMQLEESMEIKITLMNTLDQTISQSIYNQYFIKGKHRLEVELAQVPAGCYLVLLQSSRGIWIERLIVH